MIKNLLLSSVLCMGSLLGISLSAQADKWPVFNGELTMTPVLHATFLMEWDTLTIYVDPYGGAEGFSSFSSPDIVLITHAHGDHLDPKTLGGLDLGKATLVAPSSVIEKLKSIEFLNIIEMANGDVMDWSGIRIEAVPMYNLPDDETSRHPKGWGNGYVLTIGGKRIYISGDTEDIPEMRDLKNIDYAFVCMNLPYTMDINQAASAVLDFQPKVVYPYHFRGRPDFSDVEAFKKLVDDGGKAIEVRLRNWYPE